MWQGVAFLALVVLSFSVPIAYAESVAIPISFQEISGISGGGWSTDITDNTTTIELSGITNNHIHDVTNLKAEIEMSSGGQTLCTDVATISSLNIDDTGDFVWTCTGEADAATGVILGYDITLPISFQEAGGISSGSWSTQVAGTITTIQLTGISNNNSQDVSDIAAEMNFYKDDEIICTDTDTISSILANDSGNFVWECSGIPDSASGGIIDHVMVDAVDQTEPVDEPTESTTTESTPQSTTESTTTQSTSSSSSDDDGPTNEIVTAFVVDGHDMTITVADYQGTKKFLTFTGEGFGPSETFDINVYDSSGTEISDIGTSTSNSGFFSVPAIVETTDLNLENYTVLLAGLNTNIEFVISWTGTDFSFVESQTPITSSDPDIVQPTTTPSNTESSSPLYHPNTAPSTNNVDDWDQFILDLPFEDRLELIKAVLSYLLG